MAFEVSAREINLKQQFKLLLDSTAEAIYGVDLEGRCVFSNPACARLLGHGRSEDLLGRDVHALVHHTRSDGTPHPVSECHIHRALAIVTLQKALNPARTGAICAAPALLQNRRRKSVRQPRIKASAVEIRALAKHVLDLFRFRRIEIIDLDLVILARAY